MEENYKIIIVGAGISGLTIANSLIRQGYEYEDILVLEAEDRIGGLIKTAKVDDYLCEYGPEGLRGNSQNTQYIFDLINEDPIPASNEASIRYLIHKKKMKKIPSGPLSAIFTPLLPFFGKLRLFGEPFVKPVKEDETVGDFIKRRLGKSTFPIIDAFVAGVYGGDPNKLSTRFAFPMMKNLEDMKGSLIKGGFAMSKMKKKKMKEAGIEKPKKKEKKPFLMSYKDGMEGIVSALASNVQIKLNSKVSKVAYEDQKYLLQTENGTFTSDTLIVATGVNGASRIQFDMKTSFDEIQEAKVAVVSVGYDQKDLEKEVKGYGFLSPSKENTFVLGTLFTSKLFPHHAPNGKVHLRCFVGGIRSPEKFQLSDEELIEGVMKEMDHFFKPTKEPEFVVVFRHDNKGIPQLMMGHEKVVEWKETMEAEFPNLYFAGVGWTSIACDGLISESRALVDKIASTKKIEIVI